MPLEIQTPLLAKAATALDEAFDSLKDGTFDKDKIGMTVRLTSQATGVVKAEVMAGINEGKIAANRAKLIELKARQENQTRQIETAA